ncbi:hypothetical protein [Paenibacillus flagellatus]|uniref:DUF4386 domain-containing protein n=1 Tax=Paenibacillus flagellatus TaxID=2211139 RepID=A0A2V5K9W3_9BACL|nr:hypothetical protein [Paenibacillus flagellatus]PYI56311.1 hypothetical protein DLM86_04835 [Paenibacillus flagellatus]
MITVKPSLLRVCGWMLIAAGLTNCVLQIVHLEDTPAQLAHLPHFLSMAVGVHAVMLVATPIFLLGLVGLYARQAETIRWWGWLSLVTFAYYLTFELVHAILQVYQYPVLYEGITTEEQLKAASDIANRTLFHDGFPTVMSAIAMPAVLIGFILMTVAMIRARVYSRWLALSILLLPLTFFLPWESFGRYVYPVSFLTYAAYGVLLAFEKREAAAHGRGHGADASV